MGKRPYKIRRSYSTGKYYILATLPNKPFGGNLITTGKPTIASAMNWLKDYLEPEINGRNAL